MPFHSFEMEKHQIIQVVWITDIFSTIIIWRALNLSRWHFWEVGCAHELSEKSCGNARRKESWFSRGKAGEFSIRKFASFYGEGRFTARNKWLHQRLVHDSMYPTTAITTSSHMLSWFDSNMDIRPIEAEFHAPFPSKPIWILNPDPMKQDLVGLLSTAGSTDSSITLWW